MGNISPKKRSAQEMGDSELEKVDAAAVPAVIATLATEEFGSSTATPTQVTAVEEAYEELEPSTAAPTMVDAAPIPIPIVAAASAVNDLSPEEGDGALAASTAASALVAEEDVLGSVVYLLTYLGFFAWLMKETREKTSYVKTACSRISDFLRFTGFLLIELIN